MSEGTMLARLRLIDFLADAEPPHLEQLAAAAQMVQHPPGKVIFREGQVLSEIYLIAAGTVALEICAPGVGCKRIMTLSTWDLLGVSPLLEQTYATATARTTAACELIQISAGQILTLCEHDPRFGYEFMRRVALAATRRLNATRLQLIDIYGEQLPTVAETVREA